MSNDTEYTNLILEEIRGQNKVVIEAVGQMQEKMETLATKEALQVVADDVAIIKHALKDTNKEVQELDRRVTVLEHAAA